MKYKMQTTYERKCAIISYLNIHTQNKVGYP